MGRYRKVFVWMKHRVCFVDGWTPIGMYVNFLTIGNWKYSSACEMEGDVMDEECYAIHVDNWEWNRITWATEWLKCELKKEGIQR